VLCHPTGLIMVVAAAQLQLTLLVCLPIRLE